MKVKCLVLILAATGIAEAQPAISQVLNAASYSEVLAPGCWMMIVGSAFAASETAASTVQLPTLLGGVSVTVDGKQAPLLYVSANQINALIPYEVPDGNNRKATVVVTTAQGASSSFPIYINRRAPALFTRDSTETGPAQVFDVNFTPKNRVSAGDVIVVYAGGLGPTSPAASTSSGGSAVEPLNRVSDEVEVFVGDQKAEVLFAGLAPGFPGVYQLNVRVPALWTDRLYIRESGWISNIAQIGIQPGANVEGAVIAGFDQTFPSHADSSIPFYGAQFHVQFAIRPGAQPFMVVGVGDAGGWFTRIDTANKMWQTHATSPSVMSIHGDFSRIPTTVMDFSSGCSPFANNQVPAARLDLSDQQFMTWSLPPPKLVLPGNAAGIYDLYGPQPGTAGQFSATAAFGDFLQLPCGIQKDHKATFRIYVDGRVVASREFTYPLAGR